jgi:AcrR family transcriptional regulator
MARPRTFDIQAAIDQALLLFWKNGYEGTSLSDLTEAMGINRPSFYAAFESKEALFRRVLDRYAQGPASEIVRSIEAPTARGVVEGLLYGYADAAGSRKRPRGCLLVQGALACSDESDVIRRDLAERRAAVETALRGRLERAKREGDLPPTAEPADLARFIWTVCQGIAVQAAGGATRAELRRVATQALRVWPSA